LKQRFLRQILSNRVNRAILERLDTLGLQDGWLVAGCLFQTVWNLQCGRAPADGIKDYDIFYFDPADLSEEGEARVQGRVDHALADLGVPVEVKNQARVHLWYEDWFGLPYPQLTSSIDGIDRFLVTSTCIGLNPHELYAPHGLDIVYAGWLAPNPLTPHAELFRRKADSYRARWDWLSIVQ
jgi:uncharacterized protein